MNITKESRSSFSAQADEAVVSVRDISKVYPGVVALTGVDLDLRDWAAVELILLYYS